MSSGKQSDNELACGGPLPRQQRERAMSSPSSPLCAVAIGLLLIATASCTSAPPVPAQRGAAPDSGAASSSSAATAPSPAKQLPPLRVAYVAAVGSMAPLWMARESGAFERHGVPVEVM